MKVDDVVARIKETTLPAVWPVVDVIVRMTITEIGFHIANDGEICDPRPQRSATPAQQNARWSGSRGRRRR